MNKICVRILEETANDLLTTLNELSDEHDFFELRLDYLSGLNQTMLEGILNQVNVSVIATIRTENEGGRFAGSTDEYIKLIKTCYESNVDYVDVELHQLETNPDLAAQTDDKRTIVSYHNFELTPDDNQLQKILDRMQKLAPNGIYKIAVQAQTVEDVVRLTDLQRSQPKNKTIIIAMGGKGQLLRLLSLSLGAFTTYAESKDSPDNDDRLYYKKMKQLMDAMELEDGGE